MLKSVKKFFIILLSLSMTAASFTACQNNKNPQTDNSYQSNTNSEIQQNNINKLTGLSTNNINLRPVAVMINNIEYAQPLMGISKADIIYECLVEAGITRLLAVYSDISDIETIGSIRSARPPFIEIARGFQALYIHCGTSTQANAMLKDNVINSFDVNESNNWAWRDQDRLNQGYSTEHTLVTDGKTIFNNAKNSNIDMTISYNYPQKFGDNSQVNNGSSAENITAEFSSYKSTSFKYDTKENTYIVSQFGEEMYDDTYNKHNTADNVIVLNVNSYLIDKEHVNLDIVGDGSGYYFYGGKAVKIMWHKNSSDSPIIYTVENGDELIMKPGRQYVCCIPLSYTVEFS